MGATPEPWQVFFDTWDGATAHLPRITPVPDALKGRAPGMRAINDARARVRRYMTGVLGWTCGESARLAALFALEVVVWSRLDGFDRERLAVRLRRAQAKVRAAAALGLDEWSRSMAPAGAPDDDGALRAVRLPDAFYLVDVDERGEARRLPPWPDAVEYVSDGARYGVRFGSGEVEWFERTLPEWIERLRADFEGVDLFGVVEGLKEYVIRQERFPLGLANEVAGLEELLRSPRPLSG